MKNETLNILEINCETNETILRPMTAEEIAQVEKDHLDYLKKQEEAAAKEAARQALLDKLGITTDEAKLLLG
jgi:hypothetical protein